MRVRGGREVYKLRDIQLGKTEGEARCYQRIMERIVGVWIYKDLLIFLGGNFAEGERNDGRFAG